VKLRKEYWRGKAIQETDGRISHMNGAARFHIDIGRNCVAKCIKLAVWEASASFGQGPAILMADTPFKIL
jgi:hypothetical protein